MTINIVVLDSQVVTHEGLLSPQTGVPDVYAILQFYTITTGLDFPLDVPYAGDWVRDELAFPVPGSRTFDSADDLQSSVLAYPATFELLPREPALAGWGVDTAWTTFERSQVWVHALVVGKSPASYFDRLRFFVTMRWIQ